MHMIRMEPPPPHFEKEKTLFAGLYIIWIISQKQQQLCLILLHRTEIIHSYLILKHFLSNFLSIKVWLFYWLLFFAGCYSVTLLLFILFKILFILFMLLCTKKKIPRFLITCCVFII